MDRWLNRRSAHSVAAKANPAADSASDATSTLLRRAVPRCLACGGALDGHSFRYFACHPAAAEDPAAAAFLHAIHAGDWATVQASQSPALDQPLFVLYAIACPVSNAGGMVALLLTQPDMFLPDRLFHERALPPDNMAVLRAQCPTCPWIDFGPPLQFPQDPV